MSSVYTVGISDCIVSNDPASSIATHALGSCIGLAIHDHVTLVGGLLHYMLPESSMDLVKAHQQPFMFADTGIPLLFRFAYDLGAVKMRLRVTALGGAQVAQTSESFNIGKRNYLAMRKILWKAGVMVHNEDVGGSAPRTVRLEIGSGRVIVSHGREQKDIEQIVEERKRAGHGI